MQEKHTMGDRIALKYMAAGVVGMCLVAENATPDGPDRERPRVRQTETGTIEAGGEVFASWQAYARSEFFKINGMRCALPPAFERGGADGGVAGGGGADCTYDVTDPADVYDPSVVRYRIPVVVHVIRASNGTTGHVSDALVQSQIDVLNEDFLAIADTNGAPGTDVQIEFYLATEDPDGNPTSGITYSSNTTWFNDGGSYWNQLAWDTSRYMNIYTNTADGALGYVPDLPQGGIAGSNQDRIVILWSSFGRNAPIGPPFNQGRTLTHEVGHYLGLEHTFNGGCGSAAACYTTGDLICDTPSQSSPTDGCSGSSCSSPDPIHNYMDYSDDLCMWEFTPEQARRMRCSLEHYRPLLYEVIGSPTGACCIGESCSVLTEDDCLDSGGTFLGAASTCASSPCSTATGACCAANGACSITTQSACAGAGGTYQGDDSTCGTACPPPPTGACCLTGGSCQVGLAGDCAAAGGTYLGDGSGCSASSCEQPGGCGGANAGDCTVANGTPGCDDAACCATVCEADPFCCDTEWDDLCAAQAAELCGKGGGGGPCGDPTSGDCSTGNGSPGCADGDCCTTVCQADPFCCEVEWDDLCADQAAELCDSGGGGGPCGAPTSGDCAAANGSPGCADADCCATVCQADSFCCEIEWDDLCAEQAAELCDDGGQDPTGCPGDLTADGVVDVNDLIEMTFQWGQSSGPADLNGDGQVGVDDVLILIINWGPCAP
jgi:hypothetical protein